MATTATKGDLLKAAKKEKSKPTLNIEPKKGAALPKGSYEMLNLELGKIKVIPKFNPRESLGDLTNLTKSVREHGIEQSIVVRPMLGKIGVYELITGHRRFAVAAKVSLKTIPAIVRNDLGNNSDALAFALAENSEESRDNLTPLEQGKAFKRLIEANKKLGPKEIAGKCGCSDQHVRRMLRIVDSPKEILQRLEKGEIKSGAAAAVAEMNPKIQKKVIDAIEPGMTESEVRKLGNQVARDENVDAKKNKAKRKDPAASVKSGEMIVTRSRKEMHMLEDSLVCDILDAKEAGGNTKSFQYALSVVFYFFNKVDKIGNVDSPAFKKAFDGIAKHAVKVDDKKAKK